MNPQEMLERLGTIELKLQSLLRDISVMRAIVTDSTSRRNSEQKELNFFTALRAEDEHGRDITRTYLPES